MQEKRLNMLMLSELRKKGMPMLFSELIITKKLASTLRKTASMLSKKTLCCNLISLKPGAVASGFFCEFADVFNLLFLFAVIKYLLIKL